MAADYEVKLQILFISSAARPGSQSLFIVEASPSYMEGEASILVWPMYLQI